MLFLGSKVKSAFFIVAYLLRAAMADPVDQRIVLFIEGLLKWHIQNRCLYILVSQGQTKIKEGVT